MSAGCTTLIAHGPALGWMLLAGEVNKKWEDRFTSDKGNVRELSREHRAAPWPCCFSTG